MQSSLQMLRMILSRFDLLQASDTADGSLLVFVRGYVSHVPGLLSGSLVSFDTHLMVHQA